MRLKALWFVIPLLVIGLFFGRWFVRGEHPIQPNGGRPLQIKIAAPVLLQTNPLWAEDRLGGSSDTLGNSGCTLCCLSMTMCAIGHGVTPKALNEELRRQNGFTGSGLLIWSAAERLLDGRYAIHISNRPSHATIDAQLEKGTPVIAKLLLDDWVSHWVLIVGKQGQDYLIHDPLGKPAGYEAIGKYNSKIHAIRYLTRN